MSGPQKNPPPLLNRSFVLVTFLGCLYFFNFHSFLLLPIRISELGGTEKIVGFVMGIAGLSTLFLTPYAGHITDRYGKKAVCAAEGSRCSPFQHFLWLS